MLVEERVDSFEHDRSVWLVPLRTNLFPFELALTVRFGTVSEQLPLDLLSMHSSSE